jgi:chemotaxis protein histidine kinase CheA
MKLNHNAPKWIDILKKAALELGGSARVESTPGQGSKFHMEIPGKLEV